MDLSKIYNLDYWEAWWFRGVDFLEKNLFNWAFFGQLAVIGLAFILARLFGGKARKYLQARLDRQPWAKKRVGQFLSHALELSVPIMALILIGVADTTAFEMGWGRHFLKATASMLAAWLIIRQASTFLGQTALTRFISVAAMVIAGLNVLELLTPTTSLLESIGFTIGKARITVLHIFKAGLLLIVFIRLSQLGATVIEKRIEAVADLTPSVKVLLTKLTRIGLFVMAIIISLTSIGIDLSVFALFGGAIGVGFGFGLQKVVSNLVSGVILLLDRSIKPGDVIEIGGTYGRIESMGARYVAVITRDKTEYLIPNEDLITSQVINWSFTDKMIRIKINVGVAYDADLEAAVEAVVEAAKNVNRVMSYPTPVCRVMDFGSSSIDLQLRVWINDPENGVANVMSACRLAIWRAFKDKGIEIPFPQQDVYIKQMPGAPAPLPNPSAESSPGDPPPEHKK